MKKLLLLLFSILFSFNSHGDEVELVNSSEVYECTSSDWEKFDKFMSNIW